MFDKQTAPKDPINSLITAAVLLLLFPTILLSLSASLFFNLFLSLCFRRSAPSHSPLTRLPASLISPPRFTPVTPPPSLFIFNFFLSVFVGTFHLVWPTISDAGGGEGIKENIELTTAGIISTSVAALFIKPTTEKGGGGLPANFLVIAKRAKWMCADAPITRGHGAYVTPPPPQRSNLSEDFDSPAAVFFLPFITDRNVS